MAYEGYRVKVNNTVISNDLITKGSYKFKRISRILASYYDAAGLLHEEKSPHKRAVISFSIRERSRTEHASIMKAFAVRDNASVMYWDDEAGSYKEACCKINDLEISHFNTIGGDIRYAGMQITIEEY